MLEEDKRGILLESGTNEIEVMEFTIFDSLYGINVAKVKEILVSEPVKPMPHAHPAVEGIFKPRDTVITVVDLPKYLFGKSGEKGPKDLFIITSFNKMNIAFRVHTVVGISRISCAKRINHNCKNTFIFFIIHIFHLLLLLSCLLLIFADQCPQCLHSN